MAWRQCCQSRNLGGINLIDPKDLLTAMISKWVMKACKPSISNLHVLLKHRLRNYQPYQGGHWRPSLEYFILDRCQAKKGSVAWTRAMVVWKSMATDLRSIFPKTAEEVANKPLWWFSFLPLIGFWFSKARTA